MPRTETCKRVLTWQSCHYLAVVFSLGSPIHVAMTGSICELEEVCLQIRIIMYPKEIILVMTLTVVCIIAVDFFLRFIY